MNKLNLLFVFTLLSCWAMSQTPLWSDTFEDAGAPSSGLRTPSVQNLYPSSPPYTKYFARVAPSSLNLQNGIYSNFQGSKIWAGEDIDAAANGSNFSQSAQQTITWTGINITGKTNLKFKGLFACDNQANIWENGKSGQGNPADFMIVKYRINNGTWQDLIRLFGDDQGRMAPALLTSTDSVGTETPLPSYEFTEISANISGTGNTLDLQFICHSNGSSTEELAIDNFRVFDGASLPVTFGQVKSVIKNNELVIDWETLHEDNNDHFIIEASADGQLFKKIGTVKSTAHDGRSDMTIYYTFSVQSGNQSLALMIGLSGLMGLLFFAKRKRQWIAAVAAVGILGFISCNKNPVANPDNDNNVFIRIAQVDKDGSVSYSKVVTTVKE